ncbi:MAG: cytochrome b/b6 domain-containing protein [Thiolinea sp.]
MENKQVMRELKVWDPLVRIFHWTLVLAFATSYLTGDEWDDWGNVHEISGYIILGLIVFRVIWGLVGSKYARFSDFVYSPKIVIDYLKSLFMTHPKHYLGHNPAGGWMIIILLVSLLATGITGLKVLAVEEGKGPLAQVNMQIPSLISVAEARRNPSEVMDGAEDEQGEDHFYKELHEFFGNFTLFLVMVHILGVIVSSRLHKENLARAMVTGKKSIHNDTDG